jgi:hypothetical protein
MSDIFDSMHRRFFDELFSLDEEGRKAKEKLLREAGVPEELITELTRCRGWSSYPGPLLKPWLYGSGSIEKKN